jgi:hypothetical protein
MAARPRPALAAALGVEGLLSLIIQICRFPLDKLGPHVVLCPRRMPPAL